MIYLCAPHASISSPGTTYRGDEGEKIEAYFEIEKRKVRAAYFAMQKW
jgi:hypothetical protein